MSMYAALSIPLSISSCGVPRCCTTALGLHSTQHRAGPSDWSNEPLQGNCLPCHHPVCLTQPTSQHKAKHTTKSCLQTQQQSAKTAQKKKKSTCSRRAHDCSHTGLPQAPCHSRQNLPPCALQPHAHISELHVQHWSSSFLSTRAAHPGACQYHPRLGGVSGVAGGLTHQGGIVSRAWGRAPKGSPNRHVD